MTTACLPLSVSVAQGGYLRHISELAHCKVFLKGRGSNFQEDQESPLHLHVMCRSAEDMDKARELCNSLLDTVRKQYEDWKCVACSSPGKK